MWIDGLTEALLVAWYIGVLAFFEGLLSADNAIVLALMVRHLPKAEQRRVLYYGIWGAVGFRFIALLLAAILIKVLALQGHWGWVPSLSGGFAFPVARRMIKRLHPRPPPTVRSPTRASCFSGFWGTVVSVTLTDIAFSIDSILFAVGMAEDFPRRFGENWKLFILFAGGVLGIITMRFAVRYFLILLDRFPGLATGAYVIVAWIGLKLLISGLHDAEFITNFLGFPIVEIPEWLFWSVMILIAAISPFLGRRSKSGEGADLSRSLDLFDSQAEPSADGVPIELCDRNGSAAKAQPLKADRQESTNNDPNVH